jgi:hypothetical protein
MSEQVYVPILIDKQAEMGALSQISSDVRRRLRPLVVVRTGENLERQAHEDFSPVQCWGTDEPIMLDTRSLSAKDSAWYLTACIDVGVRVVPVISLGVPPSRASVRAIARSSNGACLRVHRSELSTPDAEVRRAVDSTLRLAAIDRSATDVVIDLRGVRQDVGIARGIAHALAQWCSAAGPGWRTVVVAGSAFPEVLRDEVGNGKREVLPRSELTIWRAALTELGEVGFGDYGVIPCTETKDIPRQGAANMRFATEDSWVVERGNPPKDDPHTVAFPRLARSMAATRLFRDFNRRALHCKGCEFIKAAQGGGSTQWRQAHFVHHFTVSAMQI